MGVELNHTIVHSKDPAASAAFYAELLGVAAAEPFGPFMDLRLDNGVTLAFLSAEGMEIQTQHYAFLVDDAGFDRIFARLEKSGAPYWADPGRHQKAQINHHFGGRGVYFEDPSGHLLEAMTRPYGKWDEIG